ncbi:MAG: hypothetical protein Q4G68_08705 [Planctomycetia bacterium]|nr:hypothetical protein [Planctomycetia bacterium]
MYKICHTAVTLSTLLLTVMCYAGEPTGPSGSDLNGPSDRLVLSELTDFHIHLRGGMTAELAAERTQRTGLRSGVLENVGRDWPLSDNEKLRAFLENAESVRATRQKEVTGEKKLLIGIQVNDRDWYKTMDLKLYRRLDFVLADTMIMGTDAKGQPQKLWLLPDDYDVDKDAWFERYLEHTLTVLDEPIDILANPTYLPKFIAADYDHYWTDQAMQKVIDKAIANNVALEIQAESEFPSLRFLQLARKSGAKFSFGTNNFDATEKNLDTWYKALNELALKKSDLWQTRR